MLEIINNLRPFFEDCYRRVGVREYARLIKVSPPTASKLLSAYQKFGLLLHEKDRRYLLFYANKNSADFRDVCRLYWRHRLAPVVSYFEHELVTPTVIMYGSLAKAEVRKESDVDLLLLAPKNKKELDVGMFEKELKRSIHVFWVPVLSKLPSPQLQESMVNGYVLAGRIVL